MCSAWIRGSATFSAGTSSSRTTDRRGRAVDRRSGRGGHRRLRLHRHAGVHRLHRHTWETAIRGIAPDVSLGGYFDLVLDQLAPAYRPEDVYAGNYLGSLEAIDAGVTTLLDWSHINNTPEHSDEAIRGLDEARLRAVYCYGNPNTSLADWWFDSGSRRPRTSAGCATSTSRATTA